MSPDRRTCNQIDDVLVNRKFRASALDTRAIRSADIASDHHLVRTKLRLKLKVAPKRRGIRRTRYDTQKLENDGCRRQFRLELRNRFEILQREEGKMTKQISQKLSWRRQMAYPRRRLII